LQEARSDGGQGEPGWKRAAIGIAVVLPIVALLAFGLTTNPRNIKSPLPGRPAPDFSLERLEDGATVTLSKQRGSIVVINFWASWCLPCRGEHPELIRLANKYGPRGVQFYGILDGDNESGARRFYSELGPVPYPTLLPGKSHTGIDYGLTGIPETFVIDPSGTVAYKKTGPIEPGKPEIDAILDALLTAAER
jgi:cytochrome c biogenesis protein CcmG, thiol:disulfide interchange protein DsbE